MKILSKLNKFLKDVFYTVYETVTIDLDQDTLMKLFMEAHNRNITLNQLVNILLEEFIEKTQDMTEEEIQELFNQPKTKKSRSRTKKTNKHVN
jgi:hypothetical protein